MPHLDLALLEAEARERMGEMPYAYYAGGGGDERLLADNVAAWDRWRLHPRVLVDVASVDTATSVLGTPVASPVVAAPTALQSLAHPEGEVASARGAAGAGVLYTLSSISTRSLEDVADATPGGARWMQVYVLRDRGLTAEMVARAKAAGYRALVLTVDAPVPGLRLRELRAGVHLPDDLDLPNLPSASDDARAGGFMAMVARDFDPSMTPEVIGWLAAQSGLPVVAKGVLRGGDARRCIDAGAAAVVVSNHGARQLDEGPATADVLPEVVAAVGGAGEVYVDGGIRRPGDVAKALCLGATAVMVGRPVLWSLAAGGDRGVTDLFEWFRAELARVMGLCGAPRVADLTADLVRRAPGWEVPS